MKSPNNQLLNTLFQLMIESSNSTVESFLKDEDFVNCCSSCDKCGSLVEEMKQLQDQVTQLSNQVKARVSLTKRKMTKYEFKLGKRTETQDKIQRARQLLLTSSNSNGN